MCYYSVCSHGVCCARSLNTGLLPHLSTAAHNSNIPCVLTFHDKRPRSIHRVKRKLNVACSHGAYVKTLTSFHILSLHMLFQRYGGPRGPPVDSKPVLLGQMSLYKDVGYYTCCLPTVKIGSRHLLFANRKNFTYLFAYWAGKWETISSAHPRCIEFCSSHDEDLTEPWCLSGRLCTFPFSQRSLILISTVFSSFVFWCVVSRIVSAFICLAFEISPWDFCLQPGTMERNRLVFVELAA